MTTTVPTSGQLERTLSQRIQALYRQQLGHQPSKVTCQFFADKLVIFLENSITNAELLLAQEKQEELAEQVRLNLDRATRPMLKALIEEILSVRVVDLLSDATLETGHTGIIAVFDNPPQVRNPETIPKLKNKVETQPE